MNHKLSLRFTKIVVFFCGMLSLLGVSCLSENFVPKSLEDPALPGELQKRNNAVAQKKASIDPDSVNRNINTNKVVKLKKHLELEGKNIKRAEEILEILYSETTEDFAGTPYDSDDDIIVGAQAGYYANPGSDQAYSPLVHYGRVWTYDNGMALSLAVKKGDPTAHSRALWLRNHAQNTVDPRDSSAVIFAGWPFSKNQAYLGDNWTDCRFITGANTCALLGIGEYIASDFFEDLSLDEQVRYVRFYRKALQGILYHVESEGPNEGLVTAGWTINALKEFRKTNYSYDRILSMAGYGKRTIDGYPHPLKRVRDEKVLTEHCIHVLALVNHALSHYDQVFKGGGPYTYDELDSIRLKLRDNIFGKLYDSEKGCFITSRSESGVPSKYTAISNTSWLCLALRLDELNASQVEVLSDSLLYTINNLTKNFIIGGKTYFGAHYFQDGFEDSYITKTNLHSDVLHLEGTCELINGLLEFSDVYPNDPNASTFRSTALKLWQSLQHFIDNHGFIYASSSLKGVTEPLEASISAIWYLRICDYFEANPESYDAF